MKSTAYDIDAWIRPHLHSLVPYKSARDLLNDTTEATLLDANENPFENGGLNRYPDPHHTAIKKLVAEYKGVSPSQIVLGNGSDEVIDLILRLFCEPRQEEILIMPPTYDMYKVIAYIQGITARELPLTPDFQIDEEGFYAMIQANKALKIAFFCSPNNPTANAFSLAQMERMLTAFEGIVVIDEAYIDFADEKSTLSLLDKYSNLIVLQTLSKAWGLANLRLGMCFANPEIIAWLYKIKPPYNVNGQTQKLALEALQNIAQKEKAVKEIIEQRNMLINALSKIPTVTKVYPSDTNFLLVKVTDAAKIYDFLIAQKVVVRNRSNNLHCENTLRISVGTASENQRLIEALEKFTNS